MDDCCQLAGECPIFAYFNQMANNMNLEMYCQGNFGGCKRRQLLMSGELVPADLAPHGGVLSFDADRTRTIL
jgi:hypothetical protein